VLAVIVVGSALGWAYRQTEQADAAQRSLHLQTEALARSLAAQPRLDRSDRELLDALHEQAREQARQAEMARKGMLPDLGGMGVR